ncbi:MAG: gamma carbonic anhydrase family protein [Deltaproteobacteria bacterium]|nr:gamma carbonic anhydrase family protein [Deltaproteobacteria bacterium]
MPIYEYEVKQPSVSPSSFIHPDAVVIGDVTIGQRCFIAPGVVIRADNGPIVIGDDTSIQDNTVIHVDKGATVVIERDVLVGHSVVIHDAHIKQRCVIGMGAILLFGVVCEEGVFVGAGAVVPSGMIIPANKLVAGNPARIIKDVTPQQQSYAEYGVRDYIGFTETYRKTMKRIS